MPGRSWVQLVAEDLAWATEVARLRQSEAVRMRLPDRYGADAVRGGNLHLVGALGERAVSRLTGVYVDPSATVNTFHTRPDVGVWEVRTRTRHAYELIHRAKDTPGAAYILVTGSLQSWDPERDGPPCLWVRGWIRGVEARRPEWLQAHGRRDPAWFVPHAHLRPMEDLLRSAA